MDWLLFAGWWCIGGFIAMTTPIAWDVAVSLRASRRNR